MSKIAKLTNNNYHVLEYLYDNRVRGNFIYITQDELAETLNFSIMTTNKIMKALRELGLIESHVSRRARYALTEDGVLVVETMRKLDKKINAEG